MSVEFYIDKAGEHRWHVLEGDDITHACHEGFSSKHNALQNLFINHAMMSIFVANVASKHTRRPILGSVYISVGKDRKHRWTIKSANGEPVGMAHQGFDTGDAAIENLINTYTMLSVFVAKSASSMLGSS